MRRLIWIIAVPIVVLLAAMQFRRPDYNLPPSVSEASLDAIHHPDPQIRSMLDRSCNACHSVQARIPWYGHIWPASELLQSDVRRGRAYLDFSNWDHLSPEMSRIRLLNACEAMRTGEMPLWYYRPMHPGAAPKSAEVNVFCGWARALSPGGVRTEEGQ